MFQDRFDREMKKLHASRSDSRGSFAKGLLFAFPLAALAWAAIAFLV